MSAADTRLAGLVSDTHGLLRPEAVKALRGPEISWKDGVVYVNPGSAGPRRPGLPVTVARLRVRGSELEPEIVHLG